MDTIIISFANVLARFCKIFVPQSLIYYISENHLSPKSSVFQPFGWNDHIIPGDAAAV